MQETLTFKGENQEETQELRLTERKIGKTTFIVSTRFSDGKERDIVKTLARLIENDAEMSVEKIAANI